MSVSVIEPPFWHRVLPRGTADAKHSVSVRS